MTEVTEETVLEPCPFCAKHLAVRKGVNPYARCATEDCFGQKMPVVSLDVPEDVSAWNARAALSRAPEAEDTFQARIEPWMRECFGDVIPFDRLERGDRLLEEVFELLQSGDYPPERVAALRDYVWGRPTGEPAQEVGGVMVTLGAYCLAFGLDMHEAGETELARIWTKVPQIRAKQAAKPTGSALPVALSPPSTGGEKEDLAVARADLSRASSSQTPLSDGWFTMDVVPGVCRKFIALYKDGSGAAMFWRHDDGLIDHDGDDASWPLKGYDRWAYLPDDLEFWCETWPEDPMVLHPPADTTLSGPQRSDVSPQAPDEHPSSPSPEMGEISREEIARIIDPIAFKQWQSLHDHCVAVGDDAEEARETADWAHKATCDVALEKADQILKLKENGLSREELGGSARASRGAAGPSDCAEGDAPRSDGEPQATPRTIPTTCIETVGGDPATALRLSFQIKVF